MTRRSPHHPPRRQPRGQISLGIVGAGSLWEHRYRDAVERLGPRFSIPVVYDAVLAKAQLLATEVGADVASGLHQLFERTDVQAVLILDPAWYDFYPAELACHFRKPAFLAGALGDDPAAISSLHQRAANADTLLMTEFSRRYTPATNRLRELMVTSLGPARELHVDALLPAPNNGEGLPGQTTYRDALVGLLDWCLYIAARNPVTLWASPCLQGSCLPEQIQLGFRPAPNGQPGIIAHVRLREAEASQQAALWGTAGGLATFQVTCEKGVAHLSHPREITWKNKDSLGVTNENLSTERAEAEVMLDHFARKILGGLIPVADLQDARRSLDLLAAIQQSLLDGASQQLVPRNPVF